MLNPRLDSLPGYPFARLRRLLEPVTPPAGVAPLLMSIGEPQYPPPAIVAEVLAARAADWGKYPLLRGTPEFRRAVADWLTKRFRLPSGFIEAERNLLPVSGTREAIFMFAQVAVGRQKNDVAVGRQRNESAISRVRQRDESAPLVLVPNPLYHVYAGAAIMAGGEPRYLPATRDSGFLPDYARVPEDAWPRVVLVYLCSPANPQGTHAPLAYLKELITLAVRHDFIVAVDECYSEIYDAAKPIGALEACAAIGAERGAEEGTRALDHVVVFNSLSKRSNCAGLRSGFVAGGAQLIEAFAKLRDYASCATPLPVIHAATELWRDETHVAANRARYRAKFDIAERILGNRFGFTRPPGGFFLWLDVSEAGAGGAAASRAGGPAGHPTGDSPGEAAAKRLWRWAAIRVLPGAYLCPETAPGPGAAYLRVALVERDDTVLAQGLGRLAEVLAGRD